MSITRVYLSIKTINYTDYAGLPPILRFQAVIVKSESTLHSLHQIKQSPCNGKIHGR